MTEAHHDHWEDNLPAYLLGALDPDEASDLERHSERCGRCRAELRWLEPALGILSETVERIEPPPRLRRRLLDEVEADAKRFSEPGSGRGRWAMDKLRRGLGWRPVVAAVTLVILVLAVTGHPIGSNDDGATPEAVATFRSAGMAGVTGEVRRRGAVGELRLAGVRPLPNDRVLEAWVRRRGVIEPVRGLFAPDRDGEASARLADLRGVDLVMITVEPAGGTRAPTNAPLASIRIE